MSVFQNVSHALDFVTAFVGPAFEHDRGSKTFAPGWPIKNLAELRSGDLPVIERELMPIIYGHAMHHAKV